MIYQNIIVKDDLGISRVMKISLPNLNDMGFQFIIINRKKFGGIGTTPSYCPTLMNLAIFGHFSQYRVKR